MNKNIDKLLNNKKVLFFIPNLIYFISLIRIYNNNFIRNNGEILFYEIIVLFLITLFINFLIYLFLKRFFNNDYYKVFFISLLFNIWLIKPRLMFIIFIIVLMILFKIFIKFSLKFLVLCSSFFLVFLFVINFTSTCYYLFFTATKSVSYDNNLKINVDNNNKNPNIYWIHCDAMLGMDVMDKYFNYKNIKLKSYFNNKKYYYNENARLMVGYSTRRALPALFNPYYYDNFYKDYLLDLENVFLENKKNTDILVNYYELKDKRLHNELFRALKNKEYVTYGIGSFDQYTSLNTDYYYHYYNDFKGGVNDKFKLINYNDNKEKYNSYINLMHSHVLADNSYLKNIIDYSNNINLMKNVDVDYNNYDSTNYIPGKTIFAGLDDIFKNQSKRFVFIDYYLNHMPLSYNLYGEKIDSDNTENILFYKGSYIYSVDLLIDILEFINSNDSNAVIIVQADHGINLIDDDYIMESLNISNEEVQEIRNSVINAVYVPDKYKNGYEEYMGNPLNISRYLVNSYVGYNYEYLEDGVK